MPDEEWIEVHDITQETGIKTIPKKNKYKKAKWLSKEALQMAMERRKAKSKGAKERYIHLNAEFQRIARRDNKAFPSDQCKEIEEKNRMGMTRDHFKKIRDTKEHFMQVQFSSVTQSCLTLRYPMDYSTLGLPVHHRLLEFTQTHPH